MMRGVYLLPESKRRLKLMDYNESVLNKLTIFSYNKEAAYWQSKEEARLKTIGKPSSFVDTQIAAIAQVNNLILVTRNINDFKNFSTIKLENWF